jgi:hypothetical protein
MRALTELDSDALPVPFGSAGQTGKRSLLDLAFSFPVMVAATLVMLTVLTARSRFNDPDLWWHLKTGEIIWNTHSIPQTDLFSFTTNNHAWTDHEWLSQVTIYGAWRLGGNVGLMLWLCVCTSLLLIAAYALCSLYSGNAKVALLGALITWFFAAGGLGIRPHILGYLLLTCELLIVHLACSRNARWFLLLPPLFVVWVNCHGSFFLGLIILAIFLFSSFFEFRVGSLGASRWDKSQRRMLALAFALSVGALFLNPVGLNEVVYPLDVMFHQSTGLASVDEWQPIAFDNARAFGLLAIAAFLFVLTLVRPVELRLDELLLFAVGFGMALRHSRMLFVFGVIAAPLLSRLLSNAWDRYDPARDRHAPNAILILIALSIAGLAFPDSQQLDLQVQKENPVKAVEFIRRTGLSGRMLNDYAYGGYLIWALPEHKVFMDGRADVYDWTGVLDEFGAWATLRTDPKVLLDKYRVNFCLISRNAPMARVLPYLPGWKMAYSDEQSVIFAKSGGESLR